MSRLITPTARLMIRLASTRRPGVSVRPRPWTQTSRTSELEMMISTPAKVLMPAATTPARNSAPPQSFSTSRVRAGMAWSALSRSGTSTRATAPVR